MIAEFTTAPASLKTASEIAQTLIGLHNATAIKAKAIELLGVIVSTQSSALAAHAAQSALLKRVGELEEELIKLKTWDAERQNYQLTEIRPGAFTYALKKQSNITEPQHSICSNCYQKGFKSIL